MAIAKTPATVDTLAGTAAYTLAIEHKPQIEPRLPAGTLDNLAADLTKLGAPPGPPQVPPLAPLSPPSLAEAMSAMVILLTAFHEAILGAKAKPAVRKAYGVSSKTPTKDAKAVLAAGQTILTRAQAHPSEALSLGILPEDIVSLQAAIADLEAAEMVAKGSTAKAGATGKQKHAATARMHEAVTRIAGAGALAFATNPAVRMQFEALQPKKKS